MESSLGELLRGLVRVQFKESGLYPKGNVGLVLVLMIFKAVRLTKCDPLEKGMANHFSILALRTP